MNPSRLSKPFAFGVTITAAVIVVAGLVAIGPPSLNRTRRFDERRSVDLRSIQRGVDVYWTRHDRLPRSLDELAGEPGFGPALRLADPGTGEAYEFRPVAGSRYELCAVFESAASGASPGGAYWSHDSGRQCFRTDADPVEP